jgi:aminoglycoside phosphotransferase (APT) family kinase protein
MSEPETAALDLDQMSRWAEAVTAESVEHIDRIALGYSRATFVLTCASGRRLIARVDIPGTPMAGTPLSLTREREVYLALRGSAVRLADLLGATEDGTVLLFDLVAGTHELDHLARADREAVVNDYIDQLAQLHTTPLSSLDLPSYRIESSTSTTVEADLDRWSQALTARMVQPWPFLQVAIRVLRANAPVEVESILSVCHGDVGPRNFMHDGATVTALLDWEFWHVGEPYDDLAWWIWRGHERFAGNGQLMPQLHRWSARTGLPIDGAKIDYYQIVVRVRALAVAEIGLSQHVRGVDHSGLLPIVETLTFQIARDLLHLVGRRFDPEWTGSGSVDATTVADDALTFARRDLREVIGPELTSQEASRQATALLTYLDHFEASLRLGPSVEHADALDLEKLVEAGQDDLELLDFFGRRAYRHLQLWPAAAARVLPPIRITELTIPTTNEDRR